MDPMLRILLEVTYEAIVDAGNLFLKLLYAGGLSHCYMLDESIYNFRRVGSILSLLFNF